MGETASGRNGAEGSSSEAAPQDSSGGGGTKPY